MGIYVYTALPPDYMRVISPCERACARRRCDTRFLARPRAVNLGSVMSISGEWRRPWAAPVRRHPFLDRAAPVLTHIWPKPAAGTARPPAPTLPAALLDDTQRLFIAGPHPAIYTRLEANAPWSTRVCAPRRRDGDAGQTPGSSRSRTTFTPRSGWPRRASSAGTARGRRRARGDRRRPVAPARTGARRWARPREGVESITVVRCTRLRPYTGKSLKIRSSINCLDLS